MNARASESSDLAPGLRHLRILGSRGIPANHGGFETFAEKLSLYLLQRGWKVTVYCQEEGHGPVVEDRWNGVHRVRIPSGPDTALSTIVFDWKCVRHAARSPGLCLTLGYNTAVFTWFLKRAGIRNLINMDGIEYRREKWGQLARLWFRFNERAACRLADHMLADHPAIKKHLTRIAPAEGITVLPYGADALPAQPVAPLAALGLEPGRYLTVVARPEPENSILEIVQGFSARPRGVQLAVLGRYDEANRYHRAIKSAASDEVRFLGAIYDTAVVGALRYHCLAYLHGHQVGGTNPSLVEAMAAGNAVIAHDNQFNRWVAGEVARYFTSAGHLAEMLDGLLANRDGVERMRAASRARFSVEFDWRAVSANYEELLLAYDSSDDLSRAEEAGVVVTD